MEKERLTKAHQAAQLLTADLREVMTKTDCMALEIVALDMLEQVVKIYAAIASPRRGCEGHARKRKDQCTTCG